MSVKIIKSSKQREMDIASMRHSLKVFIRELTKKHGDLGLENKIDIIENSNIGGIINILNEKK